MQLRNVFSTDLGKGKHCGRRACPPCDQNPENRQNCRMQNILYETKCLVCNPSEGKEDGVNRKKAGRNGIYYGESSRSFHERMVEHVRDADKFSSKSHIIKHWMLSHQDLDQRPPFAFKVINKYKDCLSRQIGEAIKIHHKTDNVLNSKCEYLSNCLTRLTVLEDDWERKRREKDEEIAENEENAKFEKFRNDKMKDKNQGKDEKVSTIEEDFHPQADVLETSEEMMLMLDPNMFRKPPPIRKRDEPSIEDIEM